MPLHILSWPFGSPTITLRSFKRSSVLLYFYNLGLDSFFLLLVLYFFPFGNDLGVFESASLPLLLFIAFVLMILGISGFRSYRWCFNRLLMLSEKELHTDYWFPLLVLGDVFFYLSVLASTIAVSIPSVINAVTSSFTVIGILLFSLFLTSLILTSAGYFFLGNSFIALSQEIASRRLKVAGYAFVYLFTALVAPLFVILGANEAYRNYRLAEKEVGHITNEIKAAEGVMKYNGEKSRFGEDPENNSRERIKRDALDLLALNEES